MLSFCFSIRIYFIHSTTALLFGPTPEANQKCSAETFSAKWTRVVGMTRTPIVATLQSVAGCSARNPKRTISAVLIVSIVLVVVGIFTNFNVDVDEDILWTPRNSKALQHMDWIDDTSGFPQEPRQFIMFFHNDSGNVVSRDQVRRVFDALDSVRSLPGYDAATDTTTPSAIHGIVDFWNETAAIFDSQVPSSADNKAVAILLSASTFPDGTPVSRNDLFGNAILGPDGVLESAQSYTVIIDFPDTDAAEDFEEYALDAILALNEEWKKDATTALRVEVFADRSFSDEFTRAIVNDIPLVPIVFVVMSIFTCLVFAKRHKVHSRSLLGFGAVMSVLLSLMSGFGLMFVCGVPFTSITQLLPFIIFGVGLDDAYIIMGSFLRTDTKRDPLERIHDTIEDVGLSVTLTTLTSTAAFAFGCTSSIPAVFWLCLYAFPTIVIVLVYQVTFFIACIVLDEKRVEERRWDCFTCITVRNQRAGDEELVEANSTDHIADRVMTWYAKQLLRPVVKAVVIVIAAAVVAGSAYSTSKLKQEFKFTDVVPKGSYVSAFFEAYNDYTFRSAVVPYAYFRDVDQSDEMVQNEMEQFIADLVAIESIEREPEFFWLRDFKKFVNGTDGLKSLSFSEQIATFLINPVYNELYGDDIVLDQQGAVTASRCVVNMDNVNLEDVKEQIDAYEDQNAVTEAQPINAGRSEWAFFTYDGNYNIWAFYAIS
jgi:predicted RND superfamily exporter protein